VWVGTRRPTAPGPINDLPDDASRSRVIISKGSCYVEFPDLISHRREARIIYISYVCSQVCVEIVTTDEPAILAPK